MTTPEHRAALAGLWRNFAEHEAAAYSPLYAAVARSVADDADLLDLAAEAPPHAHLPLYLMAAVHYLVLGGDAGPLGAVYRGEAPADGVAGLFRDFALSHRSALVEVMAARRIQTNEVGRCGVLALALADIAEQHGPIAALVDAGASAGLNLLYDRYRLDYGEAGARGDAGSAVRIVCALSGRGLPDGPVPDVPVRVGVDARPVDVSDPDARRWLLACVWPDTGRLDRTAAALALAADAGVDVRAGDMARDVGTVLADVGGGGGLAVVVTSHALVYLPREDQDAFVDGLRTAAASRPLVWLSLEGPGVVRVFEPPSELAAAEDGVHPSVVGVWRFDGPGAGGGPVAVAHPHGGWARWL